MGRSVSIEVVGWEEAGNAGTAGDGFFLLGGGLEIFLKK
jgi:hypothetical protein